MPWLYWQTAPCINERLVWIVDGHPRWTIYLRLPSSLSRPDDRGLQRGGVQPVNPDKKVLHLSTPVKGHCMPTTERSLVPTGRKGLALAARCRSSPAMVKPKSDYCAGVAEHLRYPE